MRLLCELFLAAVLVWLGWSQSYQERVNHIRGVEPTPAPQVRQAAAVTDPSTTTAPRQPFVPRYAPARPAPTRSGDWMWDPAHRSPLDRSAYKSGDSSAQQAAQQSGQNYWIDSRGVRHSVTSTPSP